MNYKAITLNRKRNVTLTAFLQDVGGEFRNISQRPAVLVLPGGGYQFCSDREAECVAFAYLKAGYHAFVLRYSVEPYAQWPRPLEDYDAAMDYILAHAKQWHLMTDKIAVVGFSAGGHLAGAAITMGQNRPAAAILGYSVLREDTAKELGADMPGIVGQVDEKTCPCFFFATRTDSVVPIQNTLDMMNALNRYQISFECHIYAYGPHGFSTSDHSIQPPQNNIPQRAGNWVRDSIDWLRDLFGDFGRDGYTQPRFHQRVNSDAMAWLSLDCSVARILGNPKAREVLAPTIAKMRAQIKPLSPKQSFEDMMRFMGKMTLRDLLTERNIDVERFPELDAKLGKVPNI